MKAQALQTYLPSLWLQQMDEWRSTQSKARSWKLQGAVLFTDIAGFTALTERYLERGPEGVELLAATLDTYFGDMAMIAHQHGGDVVDFIGDALQVFWPSTPDDESGLSTACMLAAQCGLAMQRAMGAIGEKIDAALEQRISISAGPMDAHIITGPAGQARFMVSGATVCRAAGANGAAPAGAVLIEKECASLVKHLGPGRANRRGDWLIKNLSERQQPLPLPPSAINNPQWLVAALPAALHRHGQSGSSLRLAEFRTVSTVFLRFDQLDLDDVNFAHTLQMGTDIVWTILDRYGGSFERLSCDDKGITVLSAFGLPYQSHEDDSLRAVQAACDLHAALAQAGLPVSVGVTRGRVFYVDTGGQSRRHVCLVGDPVNLAARLMTAQPQGLLCDLASKESIAKHFHFDPEIRLPLKGKRDIQSAYRPIRALAPAVHQHRGEIANRAAQRKALNHKVDRLLAGHGGVAVLSGEAGIGKTRLLEFVQQRAADEHIRSLYCNGNAIESTHPYFPWKGLLESLLAADLQQAPAQGMAEKVAEYFAEQEGLKAWLPLLNDVMPLGYADTAVTSEMSGEARAASLQAVLLYLLRTSLGRQASIIFIEDLHWFDEASTELLDRLLTEEAQFQVLVLLTSRPPAEAGTRPAALLRENLQHTLALDAFPEEHIGHLVEITLKVANAPKPLVDFVFQRADGHALFTVELLHALRDEGLIMVSDGRCNLAKNFSEAALAAVPDTLEGVIVSRLDRLAAPTQQLLKTASVLGRDFSLAMLMQVGRFDDDGVASVEDADNSNFLVQIAPQPAAVYSFRHALLRDVIYGLLPFDQRRDLHRAAAQWITLEHATDLTPQAVALAHHWEYAGEPVRAIEQLEIAARGAIRKYANQEAIAHLNHVYALVERYDLSFAEPRQGLWQRYLGDAHLELWDTDAALRHFTRALATTGWPLHRTKIGLTLGILGQICVQISLRLGLSFRRSDALPQQRKKLEFAALSHIQADDTLVYQTRVVEALYGMLVSLNLAERAGSVAGMAKASAVMGTVLSDLRPARWADYYVALGRKNAEQSGELTLLGFSNLQAALYSINRADWRQAEQTSHDAAAGFELLGARLRWLQAKAVLYTPWVMRGHFDQAMPVITECQRVTAELGTSPFVRSWPFAAELTIRLARGEDTGNLVEVLEKAIADERMPAMDRLRCLGLVALTRWRAGDRDGARSAADKAWTLVSQGALLGYWIGDGVAAMIEVFLQDFACQASASARPAARRRMRRACRAMLTYVATTSVNRPKALTLDGRRLYLEGRLPAARKRLKSAVAEARRRAMPLDEAHALAALAALAGADADECRAQAAAIFRRIGAVYELNRLETAAAGD